MAPCDRPTRRENDGLNATESAASVATGTRAGTVIL
jgi:hypothetical protein